MPELPEVETIRQDLSRLIVGREILDIKTDSVKQVQPSLEIVKKAVIGSIITDIRRRAKLLLLFLSNGKILAFHLKLNGRLLFRKKGKTKDKWEHVTFFLSGGNELRFCDSRKFGWVRLIKDQRELNELLQEFGPEPLDGLDLKRFQAILATSARPIKVVLMDQTKIAGVGNIYAVDALNLAKINPGRSAKKLSPKEQKVLFEAILKTLRAGIKYRGASDQYYLDALGKIGHYQEHFLVYGREGQKCFNCGGIIKKSRLAGRGTYFCPVCQKI